MKLTQWLFGVMLLAGITHAGAANDLPVSASLSLKVPGNDARHYELTQTEQADGTYACRAAEELPVTITRRVENNAGNSRITVTLRAQENVYFNYGERVQTGYRHDDCLFYMPGF